MGHQGERDYLFGSEPPKIPLIDPKLQAWTSQKMAEVSVERLRNLVRTLLGPHTRLHSLDAMLRVEEQICNTLLDLDWPVKKQPFTFHNVRGARDYGDGEPTIFRELAGTNLVATKIAEKTRDALVVLAHYDTRRDTPGADDNVASVAALLELARILRGERLHRTIILAATDLEEVLCFGARALVENLTPDFNLLGVINFETMAFVDNKPHTQRPEASFGPLYKKQVHRMVSHQWAGDFTMIIYRGSSAKLAACFAAGLAQTASPDTPLLFRDPTDLPILGSILAKTTPFVRNFSRSDHVPFWKAGVPAIHVTDTANFRNPHYHQPTDLPDTIDYERLAAIVGATACAIRMIAGYDK